MLQILSSQFFYRDLFSYPISCEEIVGARKKKDDGGNSRTDLLPGDDCDSISSRYVGLIKGGNGLNSPRRDTQKC